MTEGGGKQPSLDDNSAIIARYGPCSFQSDTEKEQYELCSMYERAVR